MIVSVSMTEQDATFFKALGGSKWLHKAIVLATAGKVRQCASIAVTEHLLGMTEEQIKASAGEKVEVPFSFAGVHFVATFPMSAGLAKLSGKALLEGLALTLQTSTITVESSSLT